MEQQNLMGWKKSVGLFLFLLSFPLFSQNQNYSEVWLKGSETEKKVWLMGFTTGLNTLEVYSKYSLGQDTSVVQKVDSTCQSEWKSHLSKIYNELDYQKKGYLESQFIAMMDQLYKKEKNKKLTYQQVYMAALKEFEKIKKKYPEKFKP